MRANEKAFLLFVVAQFLWQICLRIKADFFSGSMTVVSLDGVCPIAQSVKQNLPVNLG